MLLFWKVERARGRVIRLPVGDIEICNPLIRWLTRGVGYLSKEGRDVRVMGRFKIDKRFVLSNSVLHRSDTVQFTKRSVSFAWCWGRGKPDLARDIYLLGSYI